MDNMPPPLFRQGASASSKLLIFIALAILCMVADARWKVTYGLRAGVQAVLMPVQWLLLQPFNALSSAGQYVQGLDNAVDNEAKMRKLLLQYSVDANQYKALLQENQRLRSLLDLQQRHTTPKSQVAQILQETADIYSHRLRIDKGSAHGVAQGSPVIDPYGVIGQVTNVYPFSSDVTLLMDKSYVIPVINTRTSLRGLAFGQPNSEYGELELRFSVGSADVEGGDTFVSSGIDGIYPAGLPVASVSKVDRRVNSTFAKVYLRASAKPLQGQQVLVLSPQGPQNASATTPNTPPATTAAKIAPPVSSAPISAPSGSNSPNASRPSTLQQGTP